ncbi:PRC and DUF2382 domain-containing protein [Altericista sp. CCNU0014]|uniref:PRC and DUF2382 domain-containing protein n=1 Tax=Altericista sp. CCNU0014 TaxID=3082949 RepID=UPI00384FA134
MTLYKIKEYDPDYRSHLDDRDIKGLDLYSGNEKIGSVDDILVDDSGKFRYLVINTGLWILGKKVLLPIGRARIDYNDSRVYADSLTRSQVENLPEFTEDTIVDYEREEEVRGVYRSSRDSTYDAPASYGVGYAGAESAPSTANTAPILDLEAGYAGYDRNTYSYDRDPDLYDIKEESHPNLKLYEERLIAGKTRQRTGEAVISKRVETETAQASVDVEKERVVVERVPASGGTVIPASEASFQEGEVARIDVYEEVPEFHKEAFVREEVQVSKVVDRDTATTEETLRREELDMDIQDRSVAQDNV